MPLTLANVRIRGRTAQINVPGDKDHGLFVYEVSFWEFTGEKQFGDPILYGPFKSDEMAKEMGRAIIKEMTQDVERDISGVVSGKYFDMKNGGVMRPWDEH